METIISVQKQQENILERLQHEQTSCEIELSKGIVYGNFVECVVERCTVVYFHMFLRNCTSVLHKWFCFVVLIYLPLFSWIDSFWVGVKICWIKFPLVPTQVTFALTLFPCRNLGRNKQPIRHSASIDWHTEWSSVVVLSWWRAQDLGSTGVSTHRQEIHG